MQDLNFIQKGAKGISHILLEMWLVWNNFWKFNLKMTNSFMTDGIKNTIRSHCSKINAKTQILSV